MDNMLQKDLENRPALMQLTLEKAIAYLGKVDEQFVAPSFPEKAMHNLPDSGIGAAKALQLFEQEYEPYLQTSTGPRFFGYVIGGNTPAALLGDWLTSTYDQNAFGIPGTVDRHVEFEVTNFLRELLSLPPSFQGVFCSGATMANYSALAIAREWALVKQGKTADDGIYGFKPPLYVTGTAHPSIYKALSLLGIGRKSMVKLPLLPNREAVDPSALETFLANHTDENIVVIANAGTVNSGDIDDIPYIASLKKKYDFFFHVEGAIGAVATASPTHRHFFEGIDKADTLTIDAHKWLNTPYDGAVVLVNGEQNRQYQFHVFAQLESADGEYYSETPFTNLAPEGSRRFRALPAWFSLMAYGKQGYADITQRNCSLTETMAAYLSKCPYLRIVHDVKLNILSFTLAKENPTMNDVNTFATAVRDNGVTFINTATVLDVPVIRVCISNYLTELSDVQAAAENIIQTATSLYQ